MYMCVCVCVYCSCNLVELESNEKSYCYLEEPAVDHIKLIRFHDSFIGNGMTVPYFKGQIIFKPEKKTVDILKVENSSTQN